MAAPDPYGNAPLVGALLRMSVDAVRARMLERLREQGFEEVVPAHLVVLQYPGPEGLRPVELAARTGMSKQALNYLLGQMEASRLLTREPDPDAPRSRRIRLTPRGARAVRTMRDAVREVEREWSEALGPGRLELLRELLTDLKAVTDVDRGRAPRASTPRRPRSAGVPRG